MGYLFFHPNYATPKEIADNVSTLQSVLNNATTIIGHNLKFDMSWLYETGFKYSGKLFDTMIFEYVAAKGLKPQLSLAACAQRYGLTPKGDILKEYLKQKKNVYEIPRNLLEEYGEGDILTTLELYTKQRNRYSTEPDIKTMWPAIQLSNEALECLIDIERAGIQIDVKALDEVETLFKAEKASLEQRMLDMSRAVMGDTPVNFSSSEHMSQVVYSRKVKDKKQWAEVFGIGTEVRGAVKKTKYNRRYKDGEFRDIVRTYTTSCYRTDVLHCTECDGRGSYFKKKVNGEDWKKPTTCPACNGAKVIYTENGTVAGFKVRPISSEYAITSGFSTDKETILLLLDNPYVPDEAKDFLECLSRLSAIDTYLTSFVEGIRKGIKPDGFCHPNFNQCVTATGRLSSSNPNWQNQPRGNTFPVRRVVVSRWTDIGGKLLDIDFSQLEYRTAVMLAVCPVGLKSILDKHDRHQTTAEIVFNVKKDEVSAEEWKEYRQQAKSRTFRPLYGGQAGNERERAYNIAFIEEHVGIKCWHVALGKEALTNKQIVTPSGRIFAFPNVRRIDADRISGKTQIVNYPVQSFATADIAWCAIVDLWQRMKDHNVASKIILQVHDSITIDCHPKELELMQELIKLSFNSTLSLLTKRFKYDTIVPIGYEISIGDNLMDKKSIYQGESVPNRPDRQVREG